VLRQFALRQCKDATGVVEDDAARAAGALVEGQKVGHGKGVWPWRHRAYARAAPSRPRGITAPTACPLALAWAAAQGQDIVPLTGTQRVKHVEQSVDAAAVALTQAQCAELEALFSPEAVSGERYPAEMLKDLGI
jgi:aryl-alcohol dehydrogenase-like predicted oxidoreductase